MIHLLVTDLEEVFVCITIAWLHLSTNWIKNMFEWYKIFRILRPNNIKKGGKLLWRRSIFIIVVVFAAVTMAPIKIERFKRHKTIKMRKIFHGNSLRAKAKQKQQKKEIVPMMVLCVFFLKMPKSKASK